MYIYIYICIYYKVEWSMEPTTTTTITTTMFLVPGGVEKVQFQQSASTHSGAGEKETLNITVIGKHVLYT